MRSLVVLAIVGFLAQLVDGALGMAYGVSATTLLLTAGIAPAVASASVHLLEVVTTAVSGTAHWRFGNVDWGRIVWLALLGSVGAFVGALALSARTFLGAVGYESVPALLVIAAIWLGALALAAIRRERQPILVEEA